MERVLYCFGDKSEHFCILAGLLRGSSFPHGTRHHNEDDFARFIVFLEIIITIFKEK